MKKFLSLFFLIISFNAFSITDEDVDKLKLQINNCYLDNVSNASISFYDKFFKFKILVNEDKSIKELIYDGENKEFLDFLNETFESSECRVLTLPNGFYEEWKEINFSFDFSTTFIQENNKKTLVNSDGKGCRIEENFLSDCLEKYCLNKNREFILEEIYNCAHNPDIVINATKIDSYINDFERFLYKSPLKALEASEEIQRYNLYVYDMFMVC